MESNEKDPFRYCEADGCTHDLSAGVLTSELLDRDGPHPTRSHTIVPVVREPLDEAA